MWHAIPYKWTPLSLNIRIPVLLSLPWWQPDCYKLWRYHLVRTKTITGLIIKPAFLCESYSFRGICRNCYFNSVFYFAVHFGTLRLASRQPLLLDIQVMSWACHWPLTRGYSSLALVMPLLNSGMSERACADRHSLATSLTSMPSV